MKAMLNNSAGLLILLIGSTLIQFAFAQKNVLQTNVSSINVLHPENNTYRDIDYLIRPDEIQKDSFPMFAKFIMKKPYDSSFTFQSESKRTSYARSFKAVGLIHSFSLVYLFASSKEKTNWQYDFGPELFRNACRNLHKALTRWPAWDNDPFVTNYLQHPYAGSIYYNLVRNRGVSVMGSFEFAIIGSSIFEFFIEAMFEQPSIQDLICTPVFGALIGEASHQLTLKLSNHGFNIAEKLIVLLLNPAYVWNHGFRVPSMQKKKELQQTRKRKAENVFR